MISKNILVDKYFTKAKEVCLKSGNDPEVAYRIFTRFDGVAALEPFSAFLRYVNPLLEFHTLPEGMPFESGDTIAIIKGKGSDLIDLETSYLNLIPLSCYCARQATDIMKVCNEKGKVVMDFAARHLYSPMDIVLASYGAEVGGMTGHSTDLGMNARKILNEPTFWDAMLLGFPNQTLDLDSVGLGTTPHALIAVFKGDYSEMTKAYLKTHPEDDYTCLIDYNNREVADALSLLEEFGSQVKGFRLDTCGENYAQIGFEQDGSYKYASETGVTEEGVRAFRNAIDGFERLNPKVYISSGFGFEKTARFLQNCPTSFHGIGTGSFIPKCPTATSDIYEVDGKRECKVGREWMYERNEKFWTILRLGAIG